MDEELGTEVTKLVPDKARRHLYKTTVKRSFNLALCHLTVSMDNKIKPKCLSGIQGPAKASSIDSHASQTSAVSTCKLMVPNGLMP